MGFRYRKSVKIAPGIKINLNKKSASVTVGGKGFHKTYNTNGQTTTSVNLPISGLSYTDRKSGGKQKKRASSTSVSSAPASSSSSVVASPRNSEAVAAKKPKLKTVTTLLDRPDGSFLVVSIIIIIVAFFLSGVSIPARIVLALFGFYFIYCYIAFRRDPNNKKYITADQLARWQQLVSSDKKTVRDLQKASVPILQELKESTVSNYSSLCSASTAADIEAYSSLLISAQQKIVDLSEFITISGDHPQACLEDYIATVDKMKL